MFKAIDSMATDISSAVKVLVAATAFSTPAWISMTKSEVCASGEPGSFHISSITPPSGIHSGQDDLEFRVFFRVDDIEATAARVREAGGEVLSVANHDSGGNAECRDDQGLRFDLFRPRAGY